MVGLVGPHIAALKTHVDLVDDWTADGWNELCELAEENDPEFTSITVSASVGSIMI